MLRRGEFDVSVGSDLEEMRTDTDILSAVADFHISAIPLYTTMRVDSFALVACFVFICGL